MIPFQIDYSTLNLEELRKLPRYTSNAKYSPSTTMGSGCFLDPPGYPTYFIRHLYDRHGNSPHRGPEAVIIVPNEGSFVVRDAENFSFEDYKAGLRKLYTPLPIDHPRVRAWIGHAYSHLRSCYYDPDGKVTKPGENRMFIYPVPSYKLRHFIDDHRFSDAWRETEKAAVEAFNSEVKKNAAEHATPENHEAVRLIRKFYPDYVPELKFIKNPSPYAGDWHEVHTRKPTIEECRTDTSRRNTISLVHGEERCQFCGYGW